MTRKSHASLFRPERGFESVHHHWDHGAQAWVVHLMAGEYYLTSGAEIIATVLGSCVSTCIRDPMSGWASMNHFMLPEDPGVDPAGRSLRYGCFAVERVINELLKRGADRKKLEVKILGGGQVIASMSDIGASNVRFVREYLRTEGIPIAVEDVGGRIARRVRYYPRTGKVMIKHLPMQQAAAVGAEELKLRKRLQQNPLAGEVELF
jgi:chemotaxis protein CheD